MKLAPGNITGNLIVSGDLTVGGVLHNGDDAWTNVASFSNSWAVHNGLTPRYMRIGRAVYLQGEIQSGNINATAFTLPTGYRPSQTLTFAVPSNGAFGILNITSAGLVVPAIGSNVYFELTCSFLVV